MILAGLIPLDEIITFDVCTHSPTTGGVSDADSTPTFDIYEETTDTGLLGSTNFTKRTSLTGDYRGTFTASAANGFEVGKWYSVLATATVGGITAKKCCGSFRLGAAETTAGTPKVNVAVMDAGTITAAVLADASIDRATFAPDTGLQSIRSGTAQSGSTSTTIKLDASASAVDDFYNSCSLLLTGGTGAGQFRTITDYVGSTKVATVDVIWLVTPDATTTFAIFPAAETSADIADAVWDEARNVHTTIGSFGEGVSSVQGNVTGSVASVVGSVGSVVGNVGGNVTGSVGSVTGAVGSVTGNVGGSVASVTGNVGGNVTGSVGSLGTQAKLDVNAEALDVLVTDTHAEPASVPSSTASLKDKIGWLMLLGRNKITQTATTQLIRNNADSATIGTATVSDDGTTATRGKFA